MQSTIDKLYLNANSCYKELEGNEAAVNLKQKIDDFRQTF